MPLELSLFFTAMVMLNVFLFCQGGSFPMLAEWDEPETDAPYGADVDQTA